MLETVRYLPRPGTKPGRPTERDAVSDMGDRAEVAPFADITRVLHMLDSLEDGQTPQSPNLIGQLRTHRQLADLQGTDAMRAARHLLELGNIGDLQNCAGLALRAHEAGVDRAGVLFATVVDRFSVYNSRRQRFGTFAYEHQGELVLAPLDGTVTDEQRAELGMSSLGDLRAGMDEANRQSARQRAHDGGLDRGKTFARIWRDPTEEQLRARWAAEGQPVWADGDELTFVCDKPFAGALVGPIFEIPMWNVGELLVLQVRVERLDEAVLTYGFWPLDASGSPAFSQRPEPDGRWRGPKARPAAPTNETMVGRLEDEFVESQSLGQPRRITIYRPPNHRPEENLPVVYATDGQFFAPYARRLDAAIEQGLTPRCVVVASHASGARTGEYFPGYDPTAFTNHERFFVDDLVRWAEAELGVAAERDRRVVFGCSDGGAHALTIGLTHPDRFGHVIAYSSGLPPNGNERWDEGKAPTIQLCAGILEGQFHTSTYAWHAFLDMTKVEHHWTERVCGHELIQWIEELPTAITRAFGS